MRNTRDNINVHTKFEVDSFVHSTNISRGPKINKNSAVAEMGDRLATIDVGRKVGRGAMHLSVWGAGSPYNTMSLGRRLPPYQVAS